MIVQVFAPAKVNLTLKIGRPRPDGYHPLESVVAFADVGDVIVAQESDTLSLEISGEFAPQLAANDGTNLILRAARALAAAAGVPARARLMLEKNLPVASGIGGGSSDAAATLKALNELWRLGWEPERLAEVGGPLGADVPVFMLGAPAAFMRGIGEICEPVRAPPLPALLVNPLQPLSTPDVYRKFDALGLGSELQDAPFSGWRDAEQAIAAMRALGNDLFAPAAVLLPEIDQIAAALRGREGVRYVGLSGSGATVFALVRDRERAKALAEEFASDHGGWWVCDTLLGA
jgi:4-diphosphocytidyl-2-C-methyl-D-erythritol kinase